VRLPQPADVALTLRGGTDDEKRALASRLAAERAWAEHLGDLVRGCVSEGHSFAICLASRLRLLNRVAGPDERLEAWAAQADEIAHYLGEQRQVLGIDVPERPTFPKMGPGEGPRNAPTCACFSWSPGPAFTISTGTPTERDGKSLSA